MLNDVESQVAARLRGWLCEVLVVALALLSSGGSSKNTLSRKLGSLRLFLAVIVLLLLVLLYHILRSDVRQPDAHEQGGVVRHGGGRVRYYRGAVLVTGTSRGQRVWGAQR